MTQFMSNPNCTSNTSGWSVDGPVTINATADGMRIRRTAPGSARVIAPLFNSGSQNVWLSNMIVRRNTASSQGIATVLLIYLDGDGFPAIGASKAFDWRTTGPQGGWVYYPRSINLRNDSASSGYPYQQLSFYLQDGPIDITIRSMVVHNSATLPATHDLAVGDAGITFGVPSNTLTPTMQHNGLNVRAVQEIDWQFGDGGVANQHLLFDNDARFPALTHTYPGQGTYTVTVTVTSPPRDGHPSGQTLSRSYTVAVPSGTFAADFNHETDYLFASFDASSSVYPSNSAPTNYAWNFGDGSPVQSGASKFASHQYGIAGTYNVSLTISTAIRSHTISKPVTVVAVPGSALDFSAQLDRLRAQFVCLTPGTSISWDFGDGGTATGIIASHTYATGGPYTVTMTVDAASTTREITVTEDYDALDIVDGLRLEVQQDQGEAAPWNRVANPSGALSAAGWVVGSSTPAARVSTSPLGLTLTSGANSPNVPQAYTARIPILQGRWAAASFTLVSIDSGCYVRMRLEFANAAGSIIDGSAWSPYLNAPGRVQTTPMKTPSGALYALVTVRLTGAASETAPASGKKVTWRQTMAATSIYQSAVTAMPYSEGQAWTDILGPTNEINVSRSELDVSTLTATVLDAELDPAVSDTIRPGAGVRLRCAVDQGDGTTVWEPIYAGRVQDAQVTYDRSRLQDPVEQHRELVLNPTIKTNTDTYEDASAFATLTATADGGKLVISGAATSGWDWSIAFKFLVQRGRRYRIKWRGRRVSGTGGTLRMRIRAFRSDGPDLGAVLWDIISPAPASGIDTAQVGSGTLGQWVDTECVIEPGSIPSGAENCNLWWTPTAASGQAPNGEWTVTDVSIVEEWTPPALPVTRKASRIQLTAWDAASELANTGESRGVAHLWEIPGLMTSSAVPVVVDGGGGTSAAPTVVAVNSNASLLDQVVAARDTELGYAHVSRRGVLVLNTPAGVPTVPIATIDETVYSAADVQFASSDAINSLVVRWLRLTGGDGETSETRYGPYDDTASIQRWGQMRAEVTWQGLTEDPGDIETQARTLLAANSVPVRRVQTVNIPIRHVTDLTPSRALLDLMDLVTVRHERTGLDVPLRVTSIGHRITARGDRRRPARWVMTVGFNGDGSAARPIAVPSPPPALGDVGLPHGQAIGSSGTQSIPNATITKVTTSVLTTATAQGGITWSGANNRFTVAKDGVYLLHGRVAWANNATGTRLIYLYRNGASAVLIANPPPSNTAFGQALTAPLALVAGDYIELYAYQSSGGALNLINNAGNCGLTITYLGV